MRFGRCLASMLCALIAVHPVPAGASQPRRLGALAGPVRLVPTSSEPISIAGLHAYFGTVELNPAPDGLVVVNRLSLERYLLGLEEVPRSWPAEALQAQAVAARTYARFTLDRRAAGAAEIYGFDICASVECQVFAGADVVAQPNGERWEEAVEDTAGETILYRDDPILARYHSTSGGETLENSQVFTDERNYPYLQPVESDTEQESPLYRWRVRFSLRRLEAILTRAGWWDGSYGRLIEVHSAGSRAGFHYPDIVMVGRHGRRRTTAEELRSVVGALAAEMFPSDYPSQWRTTSGFLPETFPSNRLTVSTRRRSVTFLGRGWGHGVGMSQWGAHGLALDGATHEEILTHYYEGVKIARIAGPGNIEVGVDWQRSEVSATGAFAIEDGRGRRVVADGLGTWTFTWAGDGAVSVDPPQGFGLPLGIGLVTAPERAEPGEWKRFVVALSKPARVETVTEGPDGYEDRPARVRNAGRLRVAWRAPDEPGKYRVTVRAETGRGRRATEEVDVLVRARPEEPEQARRSSGDGGDVSIYVVLLVLVLLALGAFGLAGRIKR